MLTVLKSNGLVNRTIQAQVSVWHPPGASQVHRGRELLETVLAVLAVIILEPLGRGVDFLGRVCVFAAPGRLRDAQRRRPRSSQRECSRRRHADRAGCGWRGVDIAGRAMVMRSA